MSKQEQVFISHASQNRAVAEEISRAFEQRGVQAWLAPRDIPHASVWSASIISAIEACPVMVVLVSTHSNASAHVLREVAAAVEWGKTIVPFRIDRCELSKSLAYYISLYQWIEATSSSVTERISELVDKVTAVFEASGASLDRVMPQKSVELVSNPQNVRCSPKAVRIGQEWGLIEVGPGGVRLTARYLEALCAEAKKIIEKDCERFLTEGWVFLFVRALGEAKCASGGTVEDVSDFFEGTQECLTAHMVEVGFAAKILTGTTENFRPGEDLIAELREMTAQAYEKGSLDPKQDTSAWTIQSLVALVSARLAVETPSALGYAQYVALLLYNVWDLRKEVDRVVQWLSKGMV